MLFKLFLVLSLVHPAEEQIISDVIKDIFGDDDEDKPLPADPLAMRVLFDDIFNHLGIVPDNPFDGGRLQIRNGQHTGKCMDFGELSRHEAGQDANLAECKSQDTFYQMIWLRPVQYTGFVALSTLDMTCLGTASTSTWLSGMSTGKGDDFCLTNPSYHFLLHRKGSSGAHFLQRESKRCIDGTSDKLSVRTCQSNILEQQWLLCKFHAGSLQRNLCWPR